MRIKNKSVSRIRDNNIGIDAFLFNRKISTVIFAIARGCCKTAAVVGGFNDFARQPIWCAERVGLNSGDN